MELKEIKSEGQLRELEIIFQSFDSAIPDGESAYLAAPISTGRRFYEALAKFNASNLKDLVNKMGRDDYLKTVRWPNIEDGERLANSLRKLGYANIIFTGPIFIDGWSNKDYIDLCFMLIEQKINRVFFHPDWAFSSGAVDEYFFCLDKKLELFKHDNSPLEPKDALKSFKEVELKLLSLSIDTSQIKKSIVKIESMISK